MKSWSLGQDPDTRLSDRTEHSWSVLMKAGRLLCTVRKIPTEYFVPLTRCIRAQLNLEKRQRVFLSQGTFLHQKYVNSLWIPSGTMGFMVPRGLGALGWASILVQGL